MLTKFQKLSALLPFALLQPYFFILLWLAPRGLGIWFGLIIAIGELVVAAGAFFFLRSPMRSANNKDQEGRYSKNREVVSLAVLCIYFVTLVGLTLSKPVRALLLELAAASGRNKVIEYLVAAGTDINAASYRFTPLMMAVSFNNESTVKLLLAMGANPTVKASNGATALTLARAKRLRGLEKALSDAEERKRIKPSSD
jgi:ankyrin repeat protein